jgi:pilus assembly protein CpaE
MFSFLGAKGGVGVTTLAANFALTLAQETEKKTLIIDLGMPLGDVAINLGIRTDFSVHNALADPNRLDSSLLETLVAKHESGLALLGAPATFADLQPTPEAFDKLVAVARSTYDYVVVDAGTRVDLVRTSFFEQAETAYLITQVGITELRNANRIIIQFFAARGPGLQVILNRFTQRSLLLDDALDDAQITKTLTRAVDWKIPDDYAAARRTRDTATPLAMIDSALSSKIRELARAAADIPAEAPKKGFFRLLR